MEFLNALNVCSNSCIWSVLSFIYTYTLSCVGAGAKGDKDQLLSLEPTE
jgi:hypothetical protein